MADLQRVLQNHYNLPTLEPLSWPEEKDFSSDEEDGSSAQRQTLVASRQSKSRFSVLDRRASQRASIPGTQRSNDGVENLVQRDEPDPLGAAPSVVQVLRQRGLPVEDDLKLRNRFLLSSTTFSPSLFLSQVHNDASTDSLLDGLEFLSRSIEKKSASLKVLVESNFERFVKAKATIDNVYDEMRNQGHAPEPTSPKRPHSRIPSKTHSRNTSGLFSASGAKSPPAADKKKTALVKESEYGVSGIKAPLSEAAVKAEEVWGPALGGREKEDNLKAILNTVEKYRPLFEIGPAMRDCIKRKDHDTLVEELNKARRYAEDAKSIADNAVRSRRPLTDPEIQQIIVTARMWSDMEEQLKAFRRDVERRLQGTDFSRQPGATSDEKPDEYMSLITILLEIGCDENPAWKYLLSRYGQLKQKITSTTDRTKVETEILRRKLGNGERPTLLQLATHLKTAGSVERPGNASKTDTTSVLEFWEYLHITMTSILAVQGGLLGEVVEFWEIAQMFIDGRAQSRLPDGPNGESRKWHRLSPEVISDVRQFTEVLVELIRSHVLTFFSEPPTEDISLLFSPTPETPGTPDAMASSGLLSPRTPRSATRFKFDRNELPPPSPRKGEQWEQYAFWPPHANALGGVHYLSKILALVGTAANEMGALSLMRESPASTDQLKLLVGGVRERCVSAICMAWENDSVNCKVLEDWTRSSERRDLTSMPDRLLALETTILNHLQKIMYISEAVPKSGAPEIIVPPPTKLLQTVRQQFVGSLYKALSGMVEVAEKPTSTTWGDIEDIDSIAVPSRGTTEAGLSVSKIDANSKNIRTLLTLSNLQSVRNDIVPHLITQFETFFTVKLTSETQTIRSALSQIDSRLFQGYIKPITTSISSLITQGISSSPTYTNSSNTSSPNTRPHDARPFVYSILLLLVIVHTEVSTTASSLTSQILKYLLEQTSSLLVEAFKARPKFSLQALMQATLDVEFMAQTLQNYTTDRTTEIQSAIYLTLDERTDNEARLKLQQELPELKTILKRLRERTKGEFACFKKERKPGRPTSTQRP